MKCTKVTYFWRILIVALILASLILPLIFVKQAHAAGNTYYVTKSGNDSNDGLSSANDHAWLTIQKAANTMVAGDTVIVSAGTYNEQVTISTSGAAGNVITYRVATGASVIIDGTGIDLGATLVATWSKGLIRVLNASYIKLDGFEIYNADTDGADGVAVYPNLGSCTNLEFDNLTIHKTGRSGINFYGTYGTINNVKVTRCEVYDTNYAGEQEAISISGVTTGEVSYCKVHDMHLLGSGYRQQGIDAKDASASILIHHNEVYGGTSVGIYLDCTSADVYNNYIHDITGSTLSAEGLLLGNEIETQLNVNADIYNNIFDTCGTSFKVRQPNLHNDGTDTYTFTFTNNTIWNDRYTDYAPITLAGAAANYTTCVVRNNIIFSTVAYSANLLYIENVPTGITIDHNSYYNFAGISGATYLGTSSITSNPLLSDASNADFRILSASPCKDIGSSTGAPATDYAGTARPQGSGFDIGAYEYTAFAPTPTITPTASPTPQFTNTTAFSDGVVGINGLIMIMLPFMAIFAIVLLLNSGQNIIVALIAAAIIIYLVVAFLPGINEVINTVFGLSP